ncbi:MAG: dipicolinate synthase [Clostridia bacterium]|nr:dipicolinate synthase [Clostridia bacterium]
MTGKICVIGGDMRSAVAALEFEKDGYSVYTFGLDRLEERFPALRYCRDLRNAISGADAVILPVPYSTDGVNVNAPYTDAVISVGDVFELAGNGMTVCGGMMGGYSLRSNVRDYFESEELKILNASATAEGAIAIGMGKLNIAFNGANAVVIGYGRIGKLLSHKLRMLGCDVTVVTRKRSDSAWCEALGYKFEFVKNIKNVLPGADIVYNTVPALVLDAGALGLIKKETPVIDLASKPGGTDLEAASALGLDASLYPGIPGKNVPYSAGRIIKNTVQCYITKGKN